MKFKLLVTGIVSMCLAGADRDPNRDSNHDPNHGPIRGRHPADAWGGFARDPQHTALSPARSQPLSRILWRTPVDLQPQYTGNELLIHYGSPLITAANTVIVPVKTGAAGEFRIEARSSNDGSLKWSLPTDYILPPSHWLTAFGPALTSRRLYFPGAGGTVYFRDDPDLPDGAHGQLAFYGIENYTSNPQAFDINMMINTPITADASGNIYFGFLVPGFLPLPLKSGVARISASGQGVWIPAAIAAGDAAMTKVANNCAPALSLDGEVLYVSITDGNAGYLVALNSTTLAPIARVRLRDPVTGLDAIFSEDASSTPTVGPDGDVYYGVLESSNENHARGWLLHFDGLLTRTKTPGAFGWDDTASVVPAVMVPSYTGTSEYLLMTKYNDYVDAGGDGLNRLAVLDPHGAETDPVTGATVMSEVLAIAAPSPNGPPPAVKEWCINSAVVDPWSRSILVGNEDGVLYRWNLISNTLSESIVLTPGFGEAYTPTAIGPDGTAYAINNGILFAVGQASRPAN